MSTTALTDYKRADGSQVFADGGANVQDGRRPVKVCSTCGGFVVFVKSTAGKWYLANCYKYANNERRGGFDSFYYVKASPHFKTCANNKNANDAMARETMVRAVWSRFMVSVATSRADGLDFDAAVAVAVAELPEWLTDEERAHAGTVVDLLAMLPAVR
jgi:hypothetical protein